LGDLSSVSGASLFWSQVKVAIEATSCSKTLQEIATVDAVHLIQMRLWKSNC
jgi:hypothetical protein